ncbi:putative oxidoreductase [Thermostichus sp. MS-CIW-21]|jgi:putative oxidoreductase|uniref:DoxX family protein n=1 Tax=unclassified Synechococcus TaxID=2626047 RepID=UPI00059D601A|nr:MULTISPECIES: DoxX family protein [unclassified Synechococcus]PIK84679.1 membrane protein [Synechococcus sp. 65AY6A5]PIK86579.1 membrane protein [Synechococcus sp. 63AY4M2]PIK91934.1 membrane protein [Synechococcus sp. 65AY6Li]PIK95646.1 membrane protein [Synechococcus sp. 60AY4M2]PIK97887.1 membrane protein [Synechococcus sp. 63AY4M1]
MALTQQFPVLLVSVLRHDSVPPRWSQLGWTVLRVVAGLFMIHNGLDKLADIEGFAAAYVEVIGLPFPIFFSYVAAYTELIAAPLVALGLFTRPAALSLVATMAVAMFHHIKVAGFSIPYLELSAIYAAIFLAFAVNGGGWFSLDQLLVNGIEAGLNRSSRQKLESLQSSLQATEQVIALGEQEAEAAQTPRS